MTQCTFVSKQAGGTDPHKATFVRLYTLDGRILFSDEFIIGVPDIGIKYMDIAPGDYTAWVRADGLRFPWRYPVTISPPGPSPQVIEFVGQETGEDKYFYSVLVRGSVRGPTPTQAVGQRPVSHSAVVYSGYSRTPIYRDLNIVFRLLKDNSQDERALKGSSIVRAGADRNGYFEIELKPGSIYEVLLPGERPKKIKTQATGAEQLDRLITDTSNAYLYDLK